MTPNSTTSKPSTASDTDTKKHRLFRIGPVVPPSPDLDELLDIYWGGPERRISGLTVRIIGVNAAALIMLVLGVVYLGQYQSSLIEARLETFSTEVELVAVSLSEDNMGDDSVEKARLVKRLSATMNQRIQLFNTEGRLVMDSKTLPDISEAAEIFSHEPVKKPLYTVKVLKKMARFVLQFVPDRRRLPLYIEIDAPNAASYPDAFEAMNGSVSMSAWYDDDRHIFLTAAAPLVKDGRLLGAVLLSREGKDIEEDTGLVWINILKIFSVTLVITILLSIYLSGTIASPLRKLASAAEALRKGRNAEIPDFSHRNDEIGELSLVLRQMTQALWDRMDSTERFAADVSHELKNPLTSLRSAVETVGIVKNEKDRQKLIEVINHDIQRMDRLITDISSASRLDAELSRESLEKVDMVNVLSGLLEIHQPPLERRNAPRLGEPVKANSDAHVLLHNMGEGKSYVWGLEGRLAQIFENLVSNALSFSPPGGTVHITIVPVRKRVIVTVEDEGPGIPENNLETIFERFYTERPNHEDYGTHSGLGLSISKQIVTAFGGQIFAENIRDESQRVTGARFTVILSRA